MKELTIDECITDRNLWQGRAYESEELCSYVMDELLDIVSRFESIAVAIPDDIHLYPFRDDLVEAVNKAWSFISYVQGEN